MPASATLLTDTATVIGNGPSAVTSAASIAPAGPIMDYPGMLKSFQMHLQEAKTQLNQILINTDPTTDAANLALLNNINTALS